MVLAVVLALTARYEEDVLNAIRAAKRVLPADLQVVVAGDFNSSPAVSSQRRRSLEMFRMLGEEFGLVSADHTFFGVELGHEPHPTFYMNRRQGRPFHIDYCFVPETRGHKIASSGGR